MAQHVRGVSPSDHLAGVVRAAGGQAELERRIEVAPASARPFRDVTSHTEAYDLVLDREVVGQVFHDELSLRGMPEAADRWVLNQREADYALAASSRDEALGRARSIVAARLAATGENPSGQGPIRTEKRSPRRLGLATVLGLLLAALLAYIVRTLDR